MNRPETPEKAILIQQMASRSFQDIKQIQQWIGVTLHLSNRLTKDEAYIAAESESSIGEVFVIRLLELMNETEGLISEIMPPVPDSDLVLHKDALLKRVDELKKCFTENEHITMDYMRQCYCHINQSAYSFLIKGSTSRTIKRLNKTYDPFDVEKAIQVVFGDAAKVSMSEMDKVLQQRFAKFCNQQLNLLYTIEAANFFQHFYIRGYAVQYSARIEDRFRQLWPK
jgi:hypothetical protein